MDIQGCLDEGKEISIQGALIANFNRQAARRWKS
jgi:hypothetical protein